MKLKLFEDEAFGFTDPSGVPDEEYGKDALQRVPEGFKRNMEAWLSGKAVTLWRGMTLASSAPEEDFTIVEERKNERKSQYGPRWQHVTLDMGKFDPRWKEYPARGFSSFASGSRFEAGDFGHLGIVIPADNVSSFGIAPGDFNLTESWPALVDAEKKFWDFYSKQAGHNVRPPRRSNVTKCLELLNTLATKRGTFKGKFHTIDHVRQGLESIQHVTPPPELIEEVIQSFGPDVNGFKHVNSYTDVSGSVQGESEVWFRGPYLICSEYWMIVAKEKYQGSEK